MDDLMSDIATATDIGSFDELELYYAKSLWKGDDFSADNIAKDVNSILKCIREHAGLHEEASRTSSYQKAQELLAEAAARAQRNCH